ncbi:MAG: hypothetical protein AB1938_31910 [Myxococcota bacterium]
MVLLAIPALAQPREREKVLLMGLDVSAPELKGLAGTLAEQLLTELARNGQFEVIGASDVALVLGVERQRQLLGCAEESASCLAEIGGAMGAPWLVSGALTRAGALYRLDLKLVSTREARALARVGRTVSSHEELLSQLSELAAELLVPIAAKASPIRWRSILPWATMGIGVVTAGLGVGLMASAGSQAADLNAQKSMLYWSELQMKGASVQSLHWTGVALVGVGAAVAIGGLLWGLLGESQTPVRVSVSPMQLGLEVRF